MDQMAGTGPPHALLTRCPLAPCSTQTVLPKRAYVTLSHMQVCLYVWLLGTPERSQQRGRVLEWLIYISSVIRRLEYRRVLLLAGHLTIVFTSGNSFPVVRS